MTIQQPVDRLNRSGKAAVPLAVRVGGSAGDVTFEADWTLELKGLHRRAPSWRVCWEPAAVSAIPMPALLTDVGRIFVGRDARLERLEQLWKKTAGDRASPCRWRESRAWENPPGG